jgi:NDP-sugar pyrophosphorylase family protein
VIRGGIANVQEESLPCVASRQCGSDGPVGSIIVERPSPHLRALTGAPTSAAAIRLLNRPLVAQQLALLRHLGATRTVLTGSGAPRSRSAHAATDAWGVGPIIVLAGDIVTDVDVDAMLAFHRQRGTPATVMLPSRVRRRYTGPVDSGVYVIDVSLLPALIAGPLETLRATLRARGLPWLTWPSAAYWRRVSTPAAYHAATMDLLGGPARRLVDPPGQLVGGSWLGDDARIASDARIEPPSVIGEGTVLHHGAHVGPRAVIGCHSLLGRDVRVVDSVVNDNVVVGASAILDGCVVGANARIAPFSILAPKAVLAGGVVLRSRTLLPR